MAQDKSLDELERDVEQARARVAADIARLRAPETYEAAKSGLMERAFGYRDQMRDSATGYGEGMIETIKAKAAANPLAVAAIGAGILWRLYKHPPITTVLVGLGVASLMRTDPDDDSMQPRKLLEAASERVIEYKDRAAAQVQELRDAAVGAVEDKFEEWSSGSAAQNRPRDVVVVGSSADRSLLPLFGDESELVPYEGAPPKAANEQRDAYLLGIAALAVGGAVALASRGSARDIEDETDSEPDVVWRHY
jgi:hypothetical protein